MQIKYSPDADVLVIRLKDGKLVDSEDISDRILLHYSDKHEP
ncbi:DUF2283 domain-containing protein, partial [Candidatus Desantisbacteria bacterium]|nr:DUF2283 domain-containing protein [Candidatus Desantisbacteria bacterium]